MVITFSHLDNLTLYLRFPLVWSQLLYPGNPTGQAPCRDRRAIHVNQHFLFSHYCSDDGNIIYDNGNFNDFDAGYIMFMSVGGSG